jgi:hypothetical protein
MGSFVCAQVSILALLPCGLLYWRGSLRDFLSAPVLRWQLATFCSLPIIWFCCAGSLHCVGIAIGSIAFVVCQQTNCRIAHKFSFRKFRPRYFVRASSMMRRTTSAVEMPSSSDFFFSQAIWALVNTMLRWVVFTRVPSKKIRCNLGYSQPLVLSRGFAWP